MGTVSLRNCAVKRVSLRDWVYVELNGRSYVRDAKFKLTGDGEMFDLSQAPFKEMPVDRDTNDAAAKQARESLQKVLDDHVAAPYDPDVKSQKIKKKARAKRNRAAKVA